MSRFDFLFDEDAPFDEIVAGYQHLIDTGLAWRRADAVGRTAGNLIDRASPGGGQMPSAVPPAT